MSPGNFDQWGASSSTKRTISILHANGLSIAVLVALGVPSLFLFALRADIHVKDVILAALDTGLLESMIILLVLIGGILAHELIHGLFFSLYAHNGWKAISFGVLWQYITPYCHCSEPVLLVHYAIASLAPTVILGMIPLALSFVIVNSHMLLFGLCFIAAGSGDILLVMTLRKEHGGCHVLDLKDEVGYVIFHRST